MFLKTSLLTLYCLLPQVIAPMSEVWFLFIWICRLLKLKNFASLTFK